MDNNIFSVLRILLGIVSFVLLFRSMYLRQPDHPWRAGKLPFRDGIKFWKFKGYWKPRGYAYYVISLVCFTLYMITGLARWWE